MWNKQQLSELAQRQSSGEKVVFTNGCFDILHVGHLRYLAQARLLGDILVLGLNSDSSVRRLKGELRPLIPENERAEMLCALRCVDFVFIFSEDTPKKLIEQVRPHFLVKGGDWSVDSIVGAEFVQSYGGKVLSLPFVEGKSTTNVIEKILITYQGE